MAISFPYEIPAIGIGFSGWFVVAYLLQKPGYDSLMDSLPAGTTLSIVSPTMWIAIAVIMNLIAILLATMIYFQEVDSTNETC